jgi:branched-chain amino acid transport system ATP-binding protein
MSAILSVEHLTMRFGGLVAVNDLSFAAQRGEITALIGPNGAGKTTVFNCVTGFYKPSAGMVRLERGNGEVHLLERLPDFRIAREAKVARTFQNIRLFPGMSLLENLLVAQHAPLMRASGFTILGLLGLPVFRDAERAAIEHAKYWLERTALIDRADDPAGELPYGAQRRLEIARAMCTEPELLCLDEPAAGLNGRESAELDELLLFIRKEHGTSILLNAGRHPQRSEGHRRLSRRRGRQCRGCRSRGAIVSTLLEIRNLEAAYGRVVALKGIDLDVNAGEIVTLIGANGAGKSTLMMTIFGYPRARAGTIRFEGRDITAMPAHEIAHLKIAQSPEGRRIFSRMTVMENLQMGATVGDGAHFDEDIAKVFALFPRLKERINQRGGTLSGGEQQMLAIGRALMSRPRLLLLDEPSLGLAPLLAKQIFQAIRTLNETTGLTVFLVEQNAFHALKLAHRAYVMVNGRITMSGTGAELLRRPEIRAAYLEGGAEAADSKAAS